MRSNTNWVPAITVRNCVFSILLLGFWLVDRRSWGQKLKRFKNLKFLPMSLNIEEFELVLKNDELYPKK